MKKVLLFILLAGLLLPAVRVCAEGQTLVLHHADGTTSEVELYTLPRIQITDDKMVINVQGISQEYQKADVVRFTYKGVGTGISYVSPTTSFRVDEDRITFHGVPEADAVKVYDAKGMQIPVSLTAAGTDSVLSLASLPQGVYLVSINGRTIKFIRP